MIGAQRKIPISTAALAIPLYLALTIIALNVPILAFFVSVFVLINVQPKSPCSQVIFSLIACLSLSLMTAARPVSFDQFSDTDVYYGIYRSIREGDMSVIRLYGGGFEVGISIFFFVLSNILPNLSINGMMFFLSLFSIILFFTWLRRVSTHVEPEKQSLMIGVALLMINLYFATQTSRQFIATIFLLFAISEKSLSIKFISIAFASVFHITSIPFFVIYMLAQRWKYGWAAVLGLAVVLRLYFVDILAMIGVMPAAMAEKVTYYLNNSAGYTEADIGALRIIALLAIVSVIALVAYRFKPPPQTRAWLSAPWIAAAVHVILLPIPLMSLRTTLVVHALLPGFLIAKMLDGRRVWMTTMAVSNVLLLYKVVSFASAEGSGNLLSTLTVAHLLFL